MIARRSSRSAGVSTIDSMSCDCFVDGVEEDVGAGGGGLSFFGLAFDDDCCRCRCEYCGGGWLWVPLFFGCGECPRYDCGGLLSTRL